MAIAYQVTLNCDAPECWAVCMVSVNNADLGRAYAAERWGWSHGPDGDRCGPCTRGEPPSLPGERQGDR